MISPSHHAGAGHQHRFFLLLLLAYSALLIYGTLFPLSGWRPPPADPWQLLFDHHLANISRTNILVNILIYIPPGLLVARILRIRGYLLGAVLVATVTGGLLSLTLEYLQTYLPMRVSSIFDTAFNTSGAFIGAILALGLSNETRLGRWLLTLRQAYVQPGALANLGLTVLALWTLSQLTPLVPSLDLGNLRQGLKPLWNTLHDPQAFDLAHAGVYILSIMGLGLLADTLLRPAQRQALLFAAFVIAVLALKIPVISRQLSLEAIAGTMGGLLAFLMLRKIPQPQHLLAAALAIISAVVVDQLRAIPGAPLETSTFNWIPFLGHLSNDLIGIANILSGLWPFVALGYLTLLYNPRRPLLAGMGGGLGVFALVFALEWHQQYLPGRYADITDALLALFAWSLPWLYLARRSEAQSVPIVPQSPKARNRWPGHAWLLTTALVTTAVTAWTFLGSPFEHSPSAATKYRLPAPEELPPVTLPGFRYLHPRLPAPGMWEIHQLRKENPRFLRHHEQRAKGGKGAFYSVTLSAFVSPGSQDLELLYRRLMELEFSHRGHQQAKPLALAYDWLYDQWTEQQRAELRDKLAEGADYLINRIREQQLSPYNVYLYNSPFQALVAVTLALYGDDPRGDPVMRFTHDYWKHRVLPVWRQVMGNHGGWHEGGEYVGIGIGQAIYQVPAMWRHVTGEDLFVTEPGIRGFLDFLVYRTRPDGTHFRWGDAGFFDRAVPDRLPLAMEYHHQAAYSLEQRPRVEPTAWPWGPLADPAFYDPDAIGRLPLSRFFDGIGMIVARSDWSPQATYVTFKAGDNYWSHSHLDQGAFTLYKGGALAIDSGLYGPRYGSDHHMNYTYQTIAHNTITVTDAEDTVPAPPRRNRDQGPRYIANDGGQRRIGSGWGVEQAPLDIREWQAKREIYHTGRMENVFMEDGLTVAVADLTPAYTNQYSGKGTFSHRTRRVERFQRTFGYDQVDDAVVIFDRVKATKSQFHKRWLLHTIEEPWRDDAGFVVNISPQDRTGYGGGRLEGHVLLPRQADINLIGGEGFEYFVEYMNFDEDGVVQAKLDRKKHVEPGAWRIEVSPTHQAHEDVFLVVLLPTEPTTIPPHQVRLLEEESRIGCEIRGPHRTTRWWFDEAHNGPLIEVFPAGGMQQTYDARISD